MDRDWFLTACILYFVFEVFVKTCCCHPCFIFLFYTYYICYNIRKQVPSPSLCSFVLWYHIFVAKTTFFKLSGFPVIPLNTSRLAHRKAVRFSSQNPHQEIRSECRESFCLSHESCTQVISPHLLAIWLKPAWSKRFKATFSREPENKFCCNRVSRIAIRSVVYVFFQLWGIKNSLALRMHVFLCPVFKMTKN